MAFASRIEYWNNPENQQRQLETLNSTLKQLKNNLTIDKTDITSSRIKRISAPDPRQSAAITGYLGAGILSFVFGLLLCLDLTMCFRRSADQCWRNNCALWHRTLKKKLRILNFFVQCELNLGPNNAIWKIISKCVELGNNLMLFEKKYFEMR